jgi:flagellar basal-body rod modification protein FlgD
MTIAAVGGVLSTRSPSARTEAGTSGTSASSGSSGSSSSSSSSSSTSSGAPSMLDRDAFLKLLVAQLKYQDPSKPADASEMISQSAQLSVVDKLDQISKSINESSATNRLNLGGSIIGKQVTFAGKDGVPVSQVVTSVSFTGTTMVLRAGTWDVPIDAVTSIAQAPVTTFSPTGTTGTTGT